MNVIGIIPARMASTRFPGKPMAKILGTPMIEHCYHRTRLANEVKTVYVATCDKEISDHILKIGGEVVMTSREHKRATTRTAEAVELIEDKTNTLFDIVVMVQGDEPLIAPTLISETVNRFRDSDVEIVNIMSRLRNEEQFLDKNNVKVVIDNFKNALYFSREAIPSLWSGAKDIPMFMQTGIIAFRRDALTEFNKMPESTLEKIESVDMNRVLESGKKVRMIATDNPSIGVDLPRELVVAEQMMKTDPHTASYMQN